MEGREIIHSALTLPRAQFVGRFPDPILIGDSALDHAPTTGYVKTTAPALGLGGILPTHIVFSIPELRRQAQTRFTVGRASENDLVILDDTVSKLHAHLDRAPDGVGLTLSDAGSRNGTWAGDERLEPKTPPVSLKPGMKLRFGDVILTLVDSGAFWDRLRRG